VKDLPPWHYKVRGRRPKTKASGAPSEGYGRRRGRKVGRLLTQAARRRPVVGRKRLPERSDKPQGRERGLPEGGRGQVSPSGAFPATTCKGRRSSVGSGRRGHTVPEQECATRMTSQRSSRSDAAETAAVVEVLSENSLFSPMIATPGLLPRAVSRQGREYACALHELRQTIREARCRGRSHRHPVRVGNAPAKIGRLAPRRLELSRSTPRPARHARSQSLRHLRSTP